ncbi:MAG: P-II family nitrogen regulator [Clostridia bacterium]|nr:P-II family nitrogen regulator [Clostridia bacterium]
MELYYVICITDRKRSGDVVKICSELELPLVLTNLGRGTATSEHLSLYNLEEAEKAIVSTVADADSMRQIMRQAKRKMFIDIPGNGIIMAIPMKSVGGGKTLAYLTHGKMPNGGTPNMQFENELIIVILNEGYSDAVMEAARSAGATGGTVLHAKGTMKNQTEKFFGVSLAEEKDMIYIVSTSEKKTAIMSAISKSAGTDTKCGAFCFSLPISEVAGIRKFDEQ